MSENSLEISSPKILMKQPLPLSSSEESVEFITDPSEFLPDNFDEETSGTTESDDMSEEFESSRIVITKPKVTHVGVWLQLIFAIFVCMFGVYMVSNFLPVIIGEKGETWSNYTNTCCNYTEEKYRCSIADNCYNMYVKWVSTINKTLAIPLQKKCCYWYGPYTHYRLQTLPYCKFRCLEEVNFE